jgi:hypothetical protein
MSANETSALQQPNPFRVGLSADFCDEQGKLIFPDIGLSSFEGHPGVDHEFVSSYKPEYSPDQLADYDVLISLKPRVTAQSLEGVTRLCAIGRCGVGYDNVDLEACTRHGIAVYITPGGVVRPVAESILLLVLALSHRLLIKDRQVRHRHRRPGQHCERGRSPAALARSAPHSGLRPLCFRRACRAAWRRTGLSRRIAPRIGFCPRQLPPHAADKRSYRQGTTRAHEARCSPHQHCARPHRR